MDILQVEKCPPVRRGEQVYGQAKKDSSQAITNGYRLRKLNKINQ